MEVDPILRKYCGAKSPIYIKFLRKKVLKIAKAKNERAFIEPP